MTLSSAAADTASAASPVVSTDWLAEQLDDPELRIVDATVLVAALPGGGSSYVSGHELYLLEGHPPGALFAELMAEFSDPEGHYPFTRPGRERFEQAAGALGISAEHTVVVYDRAAGQWASRLWWLFRSFGFDAVKVLDGGFQKWRAEQRPIELGHVEPVPTVFTAPGERPELWVDKADIEAIVQGRRQAVLVCAVPAKEFAGQAGNRSRLGHIPGSESVPVGRLLDPESNALLPREQLLELFDGILASERVISYCAGGIAATADALALTLLGHRGVAVYDGSLNEWAADPDAPLDVSE